MNLKSLIGDSKDKVEFSEKSGIYKIECDDCDREYIGQSKRAISKRFKEHFIHIRNNEPLKSSGAQHVIETGQWSLAEHTINLNCLKLLKNISKSSELDANESLLIHKNRDILLNSDERPIKATDPIFKYFL